MTAAKFGVSYFGNRYVEHARRDVSRIAGCCDYIVHTVSETDLMFHKAVLAKLFAASRKVGLEIWADPWGLGGVFGGEALSRFLLDHREAWQIMSDGRVVPAACLNRNEWRSFVKEWILSVRDMGAEVILWDEPHVSFDLASELEGVYSCVCPACHQLYKKKFGSPPPPRLDDHARLFRQETIKNFLADILAFAKSKNMRNALCLYAFKGNAEYDRLFEEAATLKDLDIFGCDPYWRWRNKNEPEAHVREFSRRVVDLSSRHGKGSQIWIQGMRFPAGTEGEIHRACGAAVGEGVSHLAAWSYDGGEILDTVLSEQPEVVWRAVEDSFRRLRSSR